MEWFCLGERVIVERIVRVNGREIFIAPQALNLHTLERQLPKIFLLLSRSTPSFVPQEARRGLKPSARDTFSDLRISDKSEPQPTAIENLAILAEPSSFLEPPPL
jgi:hypothetical protein